MQPNKSTAPLGLDDLSSVLNFIQRLAADAYFGRVELSFQSGHIVNIRQERSLKPHDLLTLVASSKGTTDGYQSK